MNGDSAVSGTRKENGFTLLELVTAAAIFGILGAMLFSVVRSGMDMWIQGESSRDEMERGSAALEMIARELRLVFTENDVVSGQADIRFLSDFLDYDCDRDGTKETRLQRLFFVRSNIEERRNLEMRTAGDQILGMRYFALGREYSKEDVEGLDEEMKVFRPTGGLAEVVFMAFPPKKQKKGRGSGCLELLKGYRTPIGGEDSFFAPGALRRAKDVRSTLVPVLGDILHLEFRFWNQDTLTFDAAQASPEKEGGAGYSWDSTRGILPLERAEGPHAFRHARGAATRNDPSDDIFPPRILITVVVTAGKNHGRAARLRKNLDPYGKRIAVDVPGVFEDWTHGERYVRIDSEWIRFSRVDGGDLVVLERGARNTIPSPHKRGCAVLVGKTYEAQVEIPAGREQWNDDE